MAPRDSAQHSTRGMHGVWFVCCAAKPMSAWMPCAKSLAVSGIECNIRATCASPCPANRPNTVDLQFTTFSALVPSTVPNCWQKKSNVTGLCWRAPLDLTHDFVSVSGSWFPAPGPSTVTYCERAASSGISIHVHDESPSCMRPQVHVKYATPTHRYVSAIMGSLVVIASTHACCTDDLSLVN